MCVCLELPYVKFPIKLLKVSWCLQLKMVEVVILTANIFESGPMPTPSKFLAGLSLLPSCKLGQN